MHGPSFRLAALARPIGLRFRSRMLSDAALPPALEKVLRQFRMLGREEKMAALLSWSRKLEPLPPHLAALDREAFTVPECQTRVDLFPERDPGGSVHFYADVNARQSPTIAAVLAIVFAGVNGQPPAATLALPSDIVRLLMQDIGLGARESGLNAMITRLKRHAAAMQAADMQSSDASSDSASSP
jgi:cysteine desulfuration protein SufE